MKKIFSNFLLPYKIGKTLKMSHNTRNMLHGIEEMCCKHLYTSHMNYVKSFFLSHHNNENLTSAYNLEQILSLSFFPQFNSIC